MNVHEVLNSSESARRLSELTLLYQFSNTMLSTMRLNKLTHLVLTAITAPSSHLFERAILFLRNEKTDIMQGMLAVSRRTSDRLQIVGNQDALESRWEIDDDTIAGQRSDEFCIRVRLTRIDVDTPCPVIQRVVFERGSCHSDEGRCHICPTCTVVRELCQGRFAVVPLVSRDVTIGMIVVDNPETGGEITSQNLHFLQLLANQAGMAIENSMLYNRIEDANANLRYARERLLHGERLASIGEMAANLAHELKNPLITIGGFAGRLLKTLPVETREHHYADTIVSEVGRLELMLTEILDFSRKPAICFSPCNIEEILKDSLANCTTAFEDRNIDPTFSDCDPLLMVLGDSHQIKQVFLNLILNSCDAMLDGGRLELSAKKSLRDGVPMVVVTLEDSGGGIPDNMLSQIFNPFFTTKHHGTGLGLAIANRIIINHLGSIQAQNTGKGALFTIVLPLMEQREGM